MNKINWIKDKVRSDEYYFSRHGDQERKNDNLTLMEIEEVLHDGKILDHYSDTGRGESCLVIGFTKHGRVLGGLTK
jgi:hypothetical protein